MKTFNVRHSLSALACIVCLAAMGCASTFAVQKTQRERDIDQCTYGAVVPHNIPPADRSDFIKHTMVPACLRAKGYSE